MNDYRSRKRKKKSILSVISAVILLAVSVYGYFTHLNLESGEMAVHFINVGQGDAALLLTTEGSVLVDAGTTSSEDVLAEYITMYTDTIDYMILSHPHEDHIGGASRVFEKVEVKNVIMPDRVQDSAAFDRTLLSIEEEGSTVYPAERGDKYSLGDLKMEILSPIPDTDYKETNDVSAVIKFTFGETTFLFTGDAETLVEEQLLESGYDLDCDVLKVGHHGSSTSSSDEFIKAVSPEYAVISCGKNNTYGHPHYETKETLKKYGAEILRTDLLDDIVLISDSRSVTVKQ